MTHTKNSNKWMQEHFNDEYVKKAKKFGYCSRSTFKLKEIQEKYKIIKSGMNIIDLGAAPGGWSQYATDIVGINGKVVALDILKIKPITGVYFIQGDCRESIILEKLYLALNSVDVDLVMSDMSPNISGNPIIDQPRFICLVKLALNVAQTVLKKEGTCLIKLFQGSEFEEFTREVVKLFSKVLIKKPKASKAKSKEVYILAQGFKKPYRVLY